VRVLSTKWDNVLWWYCFTWGECSLWGVHLDGAWVSPGQVFGSTSMTGVGIGAFGIHVWMSRSLGGFFLSFLRLIHIPGNFGSFAMKARISDASIFR
jgi:hypothetical protein